MLLRKIFSFSILMLFTSCSLLAQVSDKILAVNTSEGREGEPIEIKADLANAVSVNQMFLNYRTPGMSDFKRVEMTLTGNSATAAIPGDEVVPTEVEYYFVMTIMLKDGYDTYPAENPKNNPLRVVVHPAAPKERMVVFLSPDTGRAIPSDELMIALSLKNVSPLVDISTMKLFVDGNDVTKIASIADSLITLDQQKIQPALEDGNHVFRIDLFSRKGQLYYTQTLKFSQGPLFSYEEEPSKFLYNISAQLETRHERFFNSWKPYNRGLLNLSTQRGAMTISGRVFASNEEQSERQPVNRYFIGAKTPWFSIGYGDDYPVFPSLIMSGKRLRGLTSNLKLGFFNVDFANGDVMRTIEGEPVRIFSKDSLSIIQNDPTRPNATGAFGPYDTTVTPHLWAEYRYGTFKRELTAVRPSFGGGESFQLGFTYLKAKDDVGSLKYGIKPQENLVLGSDLFIGAIERKLQITAQGAASIFNSDIQQGDISDAQIDSLFQDSDSAEKREDFRTIRDRVSKYITVNQNLVPLSIDKITSIMSYETGISLDLFDNYLKGTYLFHGSQYQSFGQTYYRRDVKGFNVFDRLRLMSNQFFLSGSYERLQDNTDDTKLATTTFSNWNGSAAYYPRFNFPNITVGYGQNTSSNGLNGLNPTGPDSIKARSAREDLTSRLFVQLGYDFNAVARHNASFNFSTSNTDDQTYKSFDTKSTIVTTMLMSTWKFPLQSTVGLSFSNSKLPSSTSATQIDFNYTTLTLGARYRLMQEKLRLSGSFIPTFGDVKRTVFVFVADYSLLSNLVASFDASMIDNTNGSTDSIVSFLLKYNM
ncbi:MAG: hypothetical protein HYZ33_04490 [Ignavibacteriales bacterium]|nr:hypothetical protein [Ignavibacteriales bacterium]